MFIDRRIYSGANQQQQPECTQRLVSSVHSIGCSPIVVSAMWSDLQTTGINDAPIGDDADDNFIPISIFNFLNALEFLLKFYLPKKKCEGILECTVLMREFSSTVQYSGARFENWINTGSGSGSGYRNRLNLFNMFRFRLQVIQV
jgi:hypothetical protein